MTRKTIFRNLLIILMIYTAFTSCINGVETKGEWIEESAIETNLCGVTWVWEKNNSNDQTDSDINPERNLVKESYLFELSGIGIHNYTYDDGVIEEEIFSWKSYKYETMHMLTFVINGETYATYYAVENNKILRMLVTNDTGDGTITKEFNAILF